ncbi:MAG: hypothetical protein FWF70_03425 [Bacteroidetes bacterium]|nr:hypothetical protein [Bacteroidota bacterium]MCL1968138.1 hypothetical protein [Bacteroidota bacterium]
MTNILLIEKNKKKLSWKNLIYIADLFEASNVKHLSLLGDESALHPDIVDYVLYLLQRNFCVNVVTGGIVTNRILETAQNYLLKIPVENLSFVCNYNHPDFLTANETKQIDKFLTTFSKYISLNFNLSQKDFELKFLVDTIIKYNLKKHIRLGLAQPIREQKNECLTLNEIRGIVENIGNQLEILEKNRITLDFGCGMPLCIFSNNDIGRLFRLNKGKVVFPCCPTIDIDTPTIDIDTDMQVWTCFPLFAYEKKSLYDFDNIEDIQKYFSEQHSNLRKDKKGMFEECKTCMYLNELCTGGCLAQLVNNE